MCVRHVATANRKLSAFSAVFCVLSSQLEHTFLHFMDFGSLSSLVVQQNCKRGNRWRHGERPKSSCQALSKVTGNTMRSLLAPLGNHSASLRSPVLTGAQRRTRKPRSRIVLSRQRGNRLARMPCPHACDIAVIGVAPSRLLGRRQTIAHAFESNFRARRSLTQKTGEGWWTQDLVVAVRVGAGSFGSCAEW